MLLNAQRSSLEVSYSVWQRDYYVGRAAKQAECVIEADDLDVVFPLCIASNGVSQTLNPMEFCRRKVSLQSL